MSSSVGGGVMEGEGGTFFRRVHELGTLVTDEGKV